MNQKLFLIPLVWFMAFDASASDVTFSKDVLPILSDRCFHCHGPDESNREAGLRLDLESAAKEDLGGYAAVVPGSFEDSELWKRITSEDEDEAMPPADSHREPLTESEREAIRKWIQSGAKWGKHWSFEKPVRSAPKNSSVNHEHPIDSFVQVQLDQAGLKMSKKARPETQLRRLWFDLTGMSPSEEASQRFTEDPTDAKWVEAVNEAIRSPHYAERMAMWWLDAARYSDSDGYQQDATRQNWPWRDWVVEQFRDNRPFDQFTIEQFAGDLLPAATDEQKLATCFHRNHMTNGEGGRDPEESRIDYVIDRVNTTGTVWLGLTLGCVQCHSHKFDPISHKDYYSLFAFFNSIDEDGKAGGGAKPYLKYQSSYVDERLKEAQEFVNACKKEEADERSLAIQRFEAWKSDWMAETKSAEHDKYLAWWTPIVDVESIEGTRFSVDSESIVKTVESPPRQDDYRVAVTFDEPTRVSGWRLEVFPDDSHVNGLFSPSGNGDFTLTDVRVLSQRVGSPAEVQIEMFRAIADYEAVKDRKTDWDQRYRAIGATLNDDARDGWTTEGAEDIKTHVGVFELDEPHYANVGDKLVIVLRQRSTHGYANIGKFRVQLTGERGETLRRVDSGSPRVEYLNSIGELSENESAALEKRLLTQYLLDDADYQAAVRKLSRAQAQLKNTKGQNGPRNVMVLSERAKARETHVLVRGVWDAKGDVVGPAVLPAVLPRSENQAKTRLDLARWILDRENPLTARVVVNHLWQLMFGQGLVRTPEDFGLQGELPTHPALLDWLAVELMDSGWDLQHIIKLIVTSETYRQSSNATEELLRLDPENRLLARAPRFRLPAWMIRDNALRVSGLLNEAIGGPPVRPYQPEGVWAEITMGRFDYQPSLGPAQYRRTIYGFWRRSVAPTFLFDSAQRRVCEVGVRRTNTPLHALTLLNDLTMLESSRALADRCFDDVKEVDAKWEAACQQLGRKVLSRSFSDGELEELRRVWSRAYEHYSRVPSDAINFATIGQQSPPERTAAPAVAAGMTLSSLVLNLDEAMTRE